MEGAGNEAHEEQRNNAGTIGRALKGQENSNDSQANEANLCALSSGSLHSVTNLIHPVPNTTSSKNGTNGKGSRLQLKTQITALSQAFCGGNQATNASPLNRQSSESQQQQQP